MTSQIHMHIYMQYACRKTLADSRPRVKGRFARNAGDDTEVDVVQPVAAAAPPQSHVTTGPAIEGNTVRRSSRVSKANQKWAGPEWLNVLGCAESGLAHVSE
jgi:hypothetical protein